MTTVNDFSVEENSSEKGDTNFPEENIIESNTRAIIKDGATDKINCTISNKPKNDHAAILQKALQKNLAIEWKKLSVTEQMKLRAKRSRQGIKCSKCGLVGYYEEFCPLCTNPNNNNQSLPNHNNNNSSSRYNDNVDNNLNNNSSPSNNDNNKIINNTRDHPTLINDDNFNYADVIDNYSTDSSSFLFSRQHYRELDLDNMSSVSSLAWNPPVQPTHIQSTPFNAVAVNTGPDIVVKKKFRNELEELEYYLNPPANTRSLPMSQGLYQPRHIKEMHKIREYAVQEADKLRENDRDVEMFAFLNTANEGYYRSYPELTLHQVLRYVIRLLQKKVLDNKHVCENDFHLSLFSTPKANRATKAGLKLLHEKKQHEMQLSIYKSDVESYNAHNPVHSQLGWKSLLSNTDILASSDRDQIEAQKLINETMEKQGLWIKAQHKAISNLNDRFEHFINILQYELKREHERETRLILKSLTNTTTAASSNTFASSTTQEKESADIVSLSEGSTYLLLNTKNKSDIFPTQHVSLKFETVPSVQFSSEFKLESMKVWQERLDAADLLMATMTSYGFICGLEQSDYLKFCLNNWKKKAKEIYKTVQNNTSFNMQEVETMNQYILDNNINNSNNKNNINKSSDMIDAYYSMQLPPNATVPSSSLLTQQQNGTASSVLTSLVTNDGHQSYLHNHQPAVAKTHQSLLPNKNDYSAMPPHMYKNAAAVTSKTKANMDNLGLISLGQSLSLLSLHQDSLDESQLPSVAGSSVLPPLLSPNTQNKFAVENNETEAVSAITNVWKQSDKNHTTNNSNTVDNDNNSITSLSFIGSEFETSEYQKTKSQLCKHIDKNNNKLRPNSSSLNRPTEGAKIMNINPRSMSSQSQLSQSKTQQQSKKPFPHRPKIHHLTVTQFNENRKNKNTLSATAATTGSTKLLKSNPMMTSAGNSPYELENIRIMENKLKLPSQPKVQSQKSKLINKSVEPTIKNIYRDYSYRNNQHTVHNKDTVNYYDNYDHDNFDNIPVTLLIGYQQQRTADDEYPKNNIYNATSDTQSYPYFQRPLPLDQDLASISSVDLETLTVASNDQHTIHTNISPAGGGDNTDTGTTLMRNDKVLMSSTSGDSAAGVTGLLLTNDDISEGEGFSIRTTNSQQEALMQQQVKKSDGNNNAKKNTKTTIAKSSKRLPRLDTATLEKLYKASREVPRQKVPRQKTSATVSYDPSLSVAATLSTRHTLNGTLATDVQSETSSVIADMRNDVYRRMSAKEIIMNAVALAPVLDTNISHRKHTEKTADYGDDKNSWMKRNNDMRYDYDLESESHVDSKMVSFTAGDTNTTTNDTSVVPYDAFKSLISENTHKSVHTGSTSKLNAKSAVRTVDPESVYATTTIITKAHPLYENQRKMSKIKSNYKTAKLESHIRSGTEYDSDLMLPALIPFPNASHVGDMSNSSQQILSTVISTVSSKTTVAPSSSSSNSSLVSSKSISKMKNSKSSAVNSSIQNANTHRFTDKNDDPLSSSYTTDKVMDNFRKNLTNEFTGHMEKRMLTLYARQTDRMFPDVASGTSANAASASSDNQSHFSAGTGVYSSSHNLGYNHMMGRNIDDFQTKVEIHSLDS